MRDIFTGSYLEQLKNEDKKAFEKFVKYYYKYVACIVENILGASFTSQDKEDVVSDVFLAMWKNISNIDIINYDNIKQYLGTIARNMSINAIRKSRKYTYELDNDKIHIRSDINIEKDMIRKDILSCIHQSLKDLNSKERYCFIQYYYYNKTIPMISKETDLKESTIKSLLARSRKKIRVLLERKGYIYADF